MTPALVIFARYPRLGRVKTRLAPVLREEGCLQLHTAFVADTLSRTAGLEVARYLYLADCSRQELAQITTPNTRPQVPGAPAALVLAAGAQPDLQIRLQQGGDLGTRLWNACREVFRHHSSVILIGTDSPTLPLGFLRQAVEHLKEAEVVLGPCADGGYYLLGLSRPRADLFEGVHWGSPRVLEQTASRVGPHQLRWLPVWYDVDMEPDLRRLREELRSPSADSPTRTQAILSVLFAGK